MSGHERASRLAIAIGALAIGTQAAAQDETEAENCISLMQIDRTSVIDNDTILFYMRDDRILENALPHACPGLDFEERFMYRTTINRLCNVDVITVLDDAGFGLVPGASCGLGKFQPITDDVAADLEESAD